MYPFNLHIGQFIINNYDMFNFMGLAMLVMLEFTLLDKDAIIKRWQVLLACTVGILLGTTGAKLTHLLLYAEEYRGMPPEKVWLTAGHAYIGGAALALLGIYILFRYYKVDFLYAGDYTLPYFGLFRTFGRIGCLMTGCCYGSLSNMPWASYFKDGLLRHPTQAYMIILSFSIFAAGRLNYRRLRDKARGAIFFSSIVMYGLGRFFVEFYRVDSPHVTGALKLSHIVLLAVSAYGLAGLYILYKRYQTQTDIARSIARIFITFFVCAAVLSVFVLAIISAVPKANYIDDVDLRISGRGIERIEYKEDSHILKIKEALQRYNNDNGIYPTQEQGLSALVNKPTAQPIPVNWRGPYIDSSKLAIYGKPYGYLLYRRGDGWSYLIISPIKKEAVSGTKEKDYTLEVELHHALTLYRMDNKQYPAQEQGLNALIKKPITEPLPLNWQGPYLATPLKDKNGKSYKYRLQDEGIYTIYTE